MSRTSDHRAGGRIGGPAAAVLLALALGACAPMLPRPDALEAIAPSKLGAQAVDVDWPGAKWWQRYGDPQLEALVDDALTGNPTLAAARARLAIAAAATGSARAPLFPQINGNGSIAYQRFSETYIFPPPFAGNWDTDNRLAIDLVYEIDLWNKNGEALASALSQQQAAAVDAQAARIVLAAGVVRGYFQLQRLFAQREVSRATIAQRERVAELTRQRFDAGLDTQVDVKQAEAALATVRTELEQTGEAIAIARHQLAALAGAGPPRGDSLVPVSLDRAPRAAVPVAVPLDFVAHRPEIVAMRWRIESSEHEIEVARAMFYPNVNLVAFIGLNSMGLANLLESASGVAGVGPAIHLPIFQGGRLNANLSGREAGRDQVVAEYNDAVIRAAREVADVLSSIAAHARIVDEQAKARAAIRAAYDLAVRRYEAGLGNYLVVLTAQTQLLVQDRLDADLKARAFELDASLARALGGGYSEIVPTATHAALQ